jgi:hypothetical protein
MYQLSQVTAHFLGHQREGWFNHLKGLNMPRRRSLPRGARKTGWFDQDEGLNMPQTWIQYPLGLSMTEVSTRRTGALAWSDRKVENYVAGGPNL